VVKKNKGVVILLFFTLFIFFIATTGVIVYYLFGNNINEHYFMSNEIRNLKNDDETDNLLDKEKYKNKIITERKLSIDYTLFFDKEGIKGKIYIDKNNELYISETNKNIVHKVSDVKFKTMYVKDYEYDEVIVYLISEDDKLYIMQLMTNDITKVYIADYKTNMKITNFVDVDLKHDMYSPGNTLFVLFEDGNIYDANSGIRYSEKIVSLYNNIYVYPDKSMSSVNSRMIQDKEGKNYKLKYVFLSYKTGDFIPENPIIIITEDDKFIYVNSDMTHVYEFNKKVKKVHFDVNYPYVMGNLNIIFEDDYEINIEAACNQYHCVNNFVE